MSEWYKYFGNVAQIGAVFAATIFGIFTYNLSNSVADLQRNVAHNAEIARDIDAITAFGRLAIEHHEDFNIGARCARALTWYAENDADWYRENIARELPRYGTIVNKQIPDADVDLSRQECLELGEAGKKYIFFITIIENSLMSWSQNISNDRKYLYYGQMYPILCGDFVNFDRLVQADATAASGRLMLGRPKLRSFSKDCTLARAYLALQ